MQEQGEGRPGERSGADGCEDRLPPRCRRRRRSRSSSPPCLASPRHSSSLQSSRSLPSVSGPSRPTPTRSSGLAADQALLLPHLTRPPLRSGVSRNSTWQSEPGQVREAVRVAIESGYRCVPRRLLSLSLLVVVSQACSRLALPRRHIDCAWAYRNEGEVGQGIKDSGIDRKDLFVTSKVRRRPSPPPPSSTAR